MTTVQAADGAGWLRPEAADGVCARMGADGPHHRASCAGRGCTYHDGVCCRLQSGVSAHSPWWSPCCAGGFGGGRGCTLSLREGGEADPLGDMCPLGREGDLDVMDVLDREGDPDVTDVHRHGGGPVPRLVAHWLGSCEVSATPAGFTAPPLTPAAPRDPCGLYFQKKLLTTSSLSPRMRALLCLPKRV